MASLDDTTNTSGRLIAAKQVQGATVFNSELEKLGAIEDVMIDKGTGRIAYAILAHGGFLGIGDRYYPLPWENSVTTQKWAAMSWISARTCCRARRLIPTRRRHPGRTTPGGGAFILITV